MNAIYDKYDKYCDENAYFMTICDVELCVMDDKYKY